MTKFSIVENRGRGMSNIEKILLQSQVMLLSKDTDFQEFYRIIHEQMTKEKEGQP